MAEDVFTLRLCEMYHCRPSELADEDWLVVSRHRAIKAAEDEYLNAKAIADRSLPDPNRGKRGR